MCSLLADLLVEQICAGNFRLAQSERCLVGLLASGARLRL
jgi:hypothetical protein